MSTPSTSSSEWRQVCADRLREVSEKLREKDTEVGQLRRQLADLEADFIFNLGLIKERDEELDRLESNLAILQREMDQQGDEFFEASERLADVQKVAAQLNQELHETLAKLNTAQVVASKAETERASWIVERVALEREILQKDMEIAQMKKQYRMQVAQLEEAKFYAESQVTKSDQEMNCLKEELQILRMKIVEISTKKTETFQISSDTGKYDGQISRPEIEQLYTQLEVAYHEIEQYRSEVELLKTQNEEHYGEGDSNLMELRTLREQNLILREIIKDLKRRLKEQTESCSQCIVLKKDLDRHKEIQQQSSAHDILQNERLNHLEDIMNQLKLRMLKDLQGQDGSSNQIKDLNTSFGDIRFMILEEKLERAAETIGTSMQTEAKHIMNEIHNIRKEIFEKYANKKNTILEKPNKSDEMIADVQTEMNLLENKVRKMFSSKNNDSDSSSTISSSFMSEMTEIRTPLKKSK